MHGAGKYLPNNVLAQMCPHISIPDIHAENAVTRSEPRLRIVSAYYDRDRFFIPENQSLRSSLEETPGCRLCLSVLRRIRSRRLWSNSSAPPSRPQNTYPRSYKPTSRQSGSPRPLEAKARFSFSWRKSSKLKNCVRDRGV